METEPAFRHGSYGRRILLAAAAALVGFVLIAILGPDEDRLQHLLFHTGVQGELRVLPDIEIIRDQDPVSQDPKHQRASAAKGLQVEVVDPPPTTVEAQDATPVPPPTGVPNYTIETKQKPADGLSQSNDVREQVRMVRPSQRSLDFVLIRLVRPRYPPGVVLPHPVTVDVAIYVENDGTVSDAYVTRGEGGKAFEEAALRAVRQWKYRYLGEEGKAEPFWDQVRWIFKPPAATGTERNPGP